jgi:hypothetical protein
LFYRYKAVAGREYVADFLIGSRDETPLATHPGDSGSLWVVDSPDAAAPLMPLAIRWGGAVFGNALEKQPFALATNLSNVCRDLNVEILRSSHLASFEYWGAVGHYTIGALACGQVQDKRLHDFMLANQDRISFKPGDITARSANDVSVPEFVPLADVPDKVWKFAQSEKPFGRKGPENPNHYADIDLEFQGRTLESHSPTADKDEFIALGKAKKTRQADVLLWEKFKKPTITCIADGCRTLAMIWESAWTSAGGNAISTDQLKPVSKARLKKIYEGQGFMPSKPLGQIDPFLQSQVV